METETIMEIETVYVYAYVQDFFSGVYSILS